MRNLIYSTILIMILLSCNDNDDNVNPNGSSNNSNNPETMILGRWKLYSVTQIFTNPDCTCKVYNINHPLAWVEFTNNPVPEMPGYKFANNFINILNLYFKNIKCQTIDFSNLIYVSQTDSLWLFDTLTPMYIHDYHTAVPGSYSFSSDKNYLYFTYTFKIETFTSTDLILSTLDAINTFFFDIYHPVVAKNTILHLKKI